MTHKKHHGSHSFVLRLWWEKGTQPHQWRGWVQHVAGGESRSFRRLADLLAFLEEHAGPLEGSVGVDDD